MKPSKNTYTEELSGERHAAGAEKGESATRGKSGSASGARRARRSEKKSVSRTQSDPDQDTPPGPKSGMRVG